VELERLLNRLRFRYGVEASTETPQFQYRRRRERFKRIDEPSLEKNTAARLNETAALKSNNDLAIGRAPI